MTHVFPRRCASKLPSSHSLRGRSPTEFHHWQTSSGVQESRLRFGFSFLDRGSFDRCQVTMMQAVRGLIARRQTLRSARTAAWPLAARSRSMSTDEVRVYSLLAFGFSLNCSLVRGFYFLGCGFLEFCYVERICIARQKNVHLTCDHRHQHVLDSPVVHYLNF